MRATTTSSNAAAEKPGDLTFLDLIRLEPRLAKLEADLLEACRQTPSWKARFRLWYWDFKLRLRQLVGSASGHPRDHVLGTSAAWDVRYAHLHGLLMRRE